jgi:hypothetical protein
MKSPITKSEFHFTTARQHYVTGVTELREHQWVQRNIVIGTVGMIIEIIYMWGSIS